MILDEMSLPSTGATANVGRGVKRVDVASPVAKVTQQDVTSSSVVSPSISSKSTSSTINAINRNTFVVKLKPPSENGDGLQIPRTNLLQLFKDHSDANNVSVVKALGIGRIVVNKALINNNKDKTVAPFRRDVKSPGKKCATISVKIPTNTINLKAPSKTPLYIRGRPQNVLMNGKENKETDIDKKDDDISNNLANFMNFKLSSIVPSSVKRESNSLNTFKWDVKSQTAEPTIKTEIIEITKEQSLQSISSSPQDTTIVDSSDDDLTSLSWLIETDKNLTKAIRSCNPDDAGISLSGDETDEEYEVESQDDNKAVFTAKSKVDCSNQGGFATRQYGQAYSPNGKPPYSFSCLIFMAVEDSSQKKLPVKDIYSWVCKHFPYFRTAAPGWKNSIRHNLSLNKCFKKADQTVTVNNTHDAVKGSLWCIDPAYRPNLIQALKRTPFYPYLYPGGMGQPLSLNNLASLLPGVRSGRVPSWSPSMTPGNSQWTDPDVASAALNLMGLKGTDAIDQQSPNVKSTIEELAAEIFNRNGDTIGSIPLVITDPADDHTYTTTSLTRYRQEGGDDRCTSPDSDKSAPDAAYEFETCGTDLESDVEECDSQDEECDLGDSGFASLRGRRKRKISDSKPKPTRKRNSRSKTSPVRKARRPASSSRSRQKRSPTKKGLKVRFQAKRKLDKNNGGKSSNKSKDSLKHIDTNSDVDSGKDSPKVESKSRSRARSRSLSHESTSERKNKRKTVQTKPSHSSPYGTRSRTQTRHSKRIAASEQGNALQRATARKRRQDSISLNWEDEEEIKLAAGSLLHLAGFRSPQSSSMSNT